MRKIKQDFLSCEFFHHFKSLGLKKHGKPRRIKHVIRLETTAIFVKRFLSFKERCFKRKNKIDHTYHNHWYQLASLPPSRSPSQDKLLSPKSRLQPGALPVNRRQNWRQIFRPLIGWEYKEWNDVIQASVTDTASLVPGVLFLPRKSTFSRYREDLGNEIETTCDTVTNAVHCVPRIYIAQ